MTNAVLPFCLALPDVTLQGVYCGQGSPVVLLHGGPGCFDYFAGSWLMQMLANRYKVCSYDQRGCRNSASTGPFTIQDNLRDLEALRQHLQAEQLGIIGHSAGAILAAHYLAAHPNQVGWFVALSPPGITQKWRFSFDTTLRERMVQDQITKINEIDYQIRHTPDARRRGELYGQRFDILLPCYVDPHHRERAPHMDHFSREVNIALSGSTLNACRHPAWTAALRAYPGRAAVIHGCTDPIPWSVIGEWQSLFPRAVVYPLEECGHFPWLEKPNDLRNALFAFLAGNG